VRAWWCALRAVGSPPQPAGGISVCVLRSVSLRCSS